MPTSVRGNVVYRYSGFQYGGDLQVDTIKVKRVFGGGSVMVELNGRHGGISEVRLSLPGDAAQALSRALQAVANEYAESVTSTH